jgi:hypothetical protein
MKEIQINNIGDLRKLTLAELAYSIRTSISIDSEYVILSAWHLTHCKPIPERVYTRISNTSGDPRKLKKFAKIPKKYCEQLFKCYLKSRHSNIRVCLLPDKNNKR